MTSRVFVRGLPPNFSEDEFKRHFSKQVAITDAKFFPHRRIGYVGYRSTDDASKAIKYFNKSFIRMSRIAVEFARPVAKQDEYHAEKHADTIAIEGNGRSKHSGGKVNPLKRKRDDGSEIELLQNPKLEEYLEVMQPRTRTKGLVRGENDEFAQLFTDREQESITVQVADRTSDHEYEVVRKSKKVDSHDESRVAMVLSTNEAIVSTDTQLVEGATGAAGILEASDAITEKDEVRGDGNPVSDADWLRSRTSRLLGLVDEDEGQEDVPSKLSGVGTLETVSLRALERHEGPRIDSANLQKPPTRDKDGPNEEANIESADVHTIRETGRLFIRNLRYDMSEQSLRELFAKQYDVDEVHVPIDMKSGNGKGFAYVQFVDPGQALLAYKSLDGLPFQGRLLHILPAARKQESKLDEFDLSKLPIKKQRQLQKRASAATSTFNWNALYMNADSVMSSIADRLGVAKSDLLDPTSSDAAVKQAHAETHVIQETKAYFEKHGVDLGAFKRNSRGETAILVKNFSYATKTEELKALFQQYGEITRFLFPPSGTIAIVEFANSAQAKAAFNALAYRKVKDSILFLEKAPRDLFKISAEAFEASVGVGSQSGGFTATSSLDLLNKGDERGTPETATLFVRNLSFSTSTDRLTEVFKPLDGFLSARVKTKTDPKRPGQTLSMGFGFLEFRSKAQAQAATTAMDGYNLDGHQLSIRASHGGLDAAEERRKTDKAKSAARKGTKLVIKNLPFEASKKDVRALFSAYGQVRSVRVPKKFDASTRGFAFADFSTTREAEHAMDALRNTHLLGRRLVLDFAAADPDDPEEEIEKMQQKMGRQVNRVAVQKLTGSGRKKFSMGTSEIDEI